MSKVKYRSLFFSETSHTIVVNNDFREPYLLLTNSSFEFRLSESHGMFNFGQICQNSEALKNLKASLMSSTRSCSLTKHAVSTNQSARYMETLL